MAQRTGSYFHLHLVSDATGETLTTVARAATAQYTKVSAVEHIYPLVRTQKQLDRVLAEIEELPGIVLYTLLDDVLLQRLENRCRELSLPCLSILGPVLQLLQSYLGTETSHRVGAQHTLNADYFKRIDALNYTMLHDDGQHLEDLEEADVVLVGVSRTSKTPTSIYLANRGVKTGNVPVVPGVEVSRHVEELSRPLVVGLYASPERIVQIRQNRLLGLRAHHDGDQYIDRKAVAEEVAFSRKLCARHNWPSIDVSRSLERCRFGSPANRSCSRPRARSAMPSCATPELRSRSSRPISTSGRSSSGARRVMQANSPRCWRGRRPKRLPPAFPAGWYWAPTKLWRSASGAFPNPATAPARAHSLRRCAAERMSFIPRLR